MARGICLALGSATPTCFCPSAAIIAGWTGRDEAAVNDHIAELAALGVAPPSSVPLYYRVSSSLLTTEATIEVVGELSSGEAEPVLVNLDGQLCLGLGSDHTDRDLEAHSVAHSKQACPKPIAGSLWSLSEVADHVDQLKLQSWIREREDAQWEPYQVGALAGIRPLDELAAAAPLSENGWPLPGTVMMCGTVPVRDGQIRPSRFFRMQLSDPVLGRQIEHEYETVCLPIVA